MNSVSKIELILSTDFLLASKLKRVFEGTSKRNIVKKCSIVGMKGIMISEKMLSDEFLSKWNTKAIE